jgi:hypothetical protein
MNAGINFASLQLIPVDPSTEAVLQTVAFDVVWHYDSSVMDLWMSYMKFKPYKGDLLQLDNRIGLIVNVTEFSFLTVVGYPEEPVQISLKKGWNLISYSSFTKRSVASVLSTVPYLRVEGYDPNTPPWHSRVYGDSDFMEPGHAYWVKVSTASILDVYY